MIDFPGFGRSKTRQTMLKHVARSKMNMDSAVGLDVG